MTQDEHSGPLRGTGSPLETAILRSLAHLEAVLDLQPTGPDRFRVGSEPDRFGRVFGGQLLAQAMAAAAATVEGQPPSAIHALFVRGGDEAVPIDLVVQRIRDGRSISTRQVSVEQAGRPVLSAMVSFAHPDPETGTDLGDDPEVDPESLPLLQDWIPNTPAEARGLADVWATVPPPVEMRIGEPPMLMGGDQKPGERTHWMRLPRPVDDRPGLHELLLTYASDYLLVDQAFRNHPEPVAIGTHRGVTVNHSLWLHRPVHFDRWLGHTLRTVSVTGRRGLVQGTIVDEAGRHVASTAQEVLISRVG